MKRGRTVAALAGALALALVAGACGGDDSSDSAEGSATTAGGAATTATTAASSGTTAAPVAQPTSMDGWEPLWTNERAAIVKRIKDNKWGKSADGKTITGPEGYTIDLTKCPAGWSETEGLTDTEIKFGQTLPQSGPAADYGNVGKGMAAIFERLQRQGRLQGLAGQDPQDQLHREGRRLRPGADDPAHRRAARLRERLRPLDPRHAEHR